MSMISTEHDVLVSEKIETGKARQARIAGVALILLALLVLFLLDVTGGAVATFKLARGRGALPTLVVPVGPLDLQVLTVVEKRAGRLFKRELRGACFVPLIGRHGWEDEGR